MFEALKGEMKDSFKEMKEKKNKKLEDINLKENQEKAIKHKKETIQALKTEIEAIKKTQTKRILDMENLDKRTGTTEASITNRIQEMEKRISGVKDTIEVIDLLVKKMLNTTNS